MKRFLLSLGLLATLLAALTLTAFAEGEVTVAIDKSRPQVGVALTATVTAPENDDTDYTVKWYTDGIFHNTDGDDGKNRELLVQGESYTPVAADYQHFLIAEVYAPNSDTPVCSDELFFSKLPVVYVDLDDGRQVGDIVRDRDLPYDHPTGSAYLSAQMRIQGNEQYAQQYAGVTQIKGRGNTSWGMSKKPYKLKLDKKTDLFKMGSNKHYVLIANFLDSSLMRNKLAYDLSGELGLVPMESTWVELVLNGAYWGNYQLCEHIRVGKGRVDISDWEDLAADVAKLVYPKPKKDKVTGVTPEDTNKALRSALEDALNEDLSWVITGIVQPKEQPALDLTQYGYDPGEADISGGYLFELSEDEYPRFTVGTKSTPALYVTVNTPEQDTVNLGAGIMDYVQEYWQAFLSAVCSPDGYVTTRVTKDGWVDAPRPVHYSQLVDVDSLAEYFLVNEIMGNEDSAKKSRFAYKEKGQLLQFGPVWDFDWGCGSFLLDTELHTSSAATGWKVNGYNHPSNFYKELTDDPYFCSKLREKYLAIRPYLTDMVKDGGLIDQYAAYLQESALVNDTKWPSYYQGNYGYNFTGNVKDLKTRYLTARFNWMDRQFADLPTLMTSLHNEDSGAPYEASNTLRFTVPSKASSFGVQSVTVTVADSDVTLVEYYVNGILTDTLPAIGGSVTVTLGADILTAEPGQDNTLSVIAKDMKGDIIARNYVQVATPQPITATPNAEGTAVTLNDPDGLLTGKSYTVYAALYDENGVYQDVKKATGLAFSQPLGDSWKLFLLDGNQAPVCPALTPPQSGE